MGSFQSKVDSASDDEWKPAQGSLSHIGEAVYQELRTNHSEQRHKMWNITRFAMVGALRQTPPAKVFTENVHLTKESQHSDWFADEMFDLMSKTTKWCDIMSLGPPDGVFLTKMKETLSKIAENAKGNKEPVIVRMMFARMGTFNSRKEMETLTEDLPEDANIQLWVGAWRIGLSWNHAKLIAVDGKYLHTGGHNMYSSYLEDMPAHDISIEIEGDAAHDAHLFANTQWDWIRTRRGKFLGRFYSILPDWVPLVPRSRANISEWPIGKALALAPSYERSIVDDKYEPQGAVPVISVGRQGAMVDGVRTFFSRTQRTPDDEALVAMFGSATKTIRMFLQALGQAQGAAFILGWPTKYFKPMVKAMWKRGVVIQIVLSNLNAGGYSNIFTLEQTQSKIIKCMQEEFPEVTDDIVREKICNKLLILTRIRHKGGKTYYQEDTKISSIPNNDEQNKIGNHSKFVIVDDVCSYTGSNNLYSHDLAEWGVIVDDANSTAKMMEDFWNPMWKASYNKYDCNVDKCMEYLKHDTDNDEVEYINPYFYSGQKKIDEIATAMMEVQN